MFPRDRLAPAAPTPPAVRHLLQNPADVIPSALVVTRLFQLALRERQLSLGAFGAFLPAEPATIGAVVDAHESLVPSAVVSNVVVDHSLGECHLRFPLVKGSDRPRALGPRVYVLGVHHERDARVLLVQCARQLALVRVPRVFHCLRAESHVIPHLVVFRIGARHLPGVPHLLREIHAERTHELPPVMPHGVRPAVHANDLPRQVQDAR